MAMGEHTAQAAPPAVKGFWQELPDALLLWPNRITLIRVLAVPLLFWLAIEHRRVPFAILCAFLWLTDCMDGMIARWFKQESAFGARFDSIADNLVYCSMVAWVYLLEPAVFRAQGLVIGIGAALLIGAQVFAYVRYGHGIYFHTYITKAAMFFAYLFLVVLVLRGFSPMLFTVLAAVIFLMALENIAITALFREAPSNVKSILLLRRKP